MINHQLFVNLLPNIWENLVGLKSDWVFVAPGDIGGTLLVDMRPYGCFIFLIAQSKRFCIFHDILCVLTERLLKWIPLISSTIHIYMI